MSRRAFITVLAFAWALLGILFVAATRNPVSDYFARQAFWLHSASGSRFYAAGDPALATREYAAMIRLRPDLMDGYQMRGRTNARMGRFREADDDDTAALARVEATERARGAAPADVRTATADLYYERGCARAGMGQYDQAIADQTRAIHYWPEIPDAHRARMEASFRAGRADAAVADAEYLIAHHEITDGKAYAVRGRVAARRGRYGRAFDDLAAACRAEGTDADNWFDLGWYAFKAGRADVATGAYREALARDPKRTAGWFRLCLAYLVTGDGDAAMDACNTGLAQSTPADRAAARRDIADARHDYPAAADSLDRGVRWVR